MVRDIVRDKSFLSQKCSECTLPDEMLERDLKDSLQAYSGMAVGIAANMIGYQKRAMAIVIDDSVKVFFNPIILSQKGPYEAEEGCLSLEGRRKARRYRDIELLYLDRKGREKTGCFTGLVAEAIQHEMDHMEGILI